MKTYDHIVIGGGVIGCSLAYRLAKEGVSVAVFDAGKAPLLAQAFLKAAMNAGAHIYEETKVFRLLIQQDRIVGITTSIGLFHATQVTIAAGVWSSHILDTTEFSLPVTPVKGECLSIRLAGPAPVKTVFAVDGCYIVPKRNKEMLIGATSIPGSFDTAVTVRGILSLLERSSRLLPVLRDGAIHRTWVGVRPQAADHLPVMGSHPFIDGLYVCTGHYRNGSLLSPFAPARFNTRICATYNSDTISPILQ